MSTSAESDPLTKQSPPPKWQFWKKNHTDSEHDNSHAKKFPPVPYWQLFRYSTTLDKILLFISLLAAITHGSLLPILTIIFGRVVDDFGRMFLPTGNPDRIDASEINDTISDTTNLFLIISFVAFALSFIQLSFALTAANRMGNYLRHRFFDSLIAQDCDFYDDSESGSLTHLVVNDINLIQGGIGDKLATACQYTSTFVVGIAVGFAYGWKLTLVVLAVTPLLLIAGSIFGNASADASGEGLGAYAEAGGIASEVLGLIRTVTAFGGQEEESRRYEESLDKAYKSSVKAAMASGLGLGTAMLLILSTYCLAFWYGGVLVRNKEMSPGDVLLTFFSITLGASSLGTAGPALKSFGIARAAAPRVFDIIERDSPINPLSEDGIIPDKPLEGHISFEHVDFNYKKRIVEDDESDLVLRDFNLQIPVGTSEAFVGKSGCGKSTVARLIQRFYDPISGSVKLDGLDVRELNVGWLRSQIGIVAQMPSLFMLSIRDNIALGAGMEFVQDKESGKMIQRRREVTEEEIINVAKMANAHNFITKLPEGYDTLLGERGAMLSGGQKQRVCIARALVRNPKILLLDESTAALDTASERIVQDALDKASHGRTTVTIAHRLSTVMNCDKIACISEGKVVERAPHHELIQKEGGFYHALWELQRVQKAKFEKEREESGAKDEDPELVKISTGPNISVSKTKADSSTKGLVELDDEEESKPDIDPGVFFRTLRMNAREWIYLLGGTGGAILAGVIWPLASIPLTRLIDILLNENDEGDVLFWALSFLVLGGMAFCGNFMQHGVLGISGEKLTRRVRAQAFRSLLRQEIGYFDLEDNSLGALTGRLSGDAGAMKGLTGDLFGVGVNLIGSLLAGLIISFIACWRLTLVVLAVIPGIALGGYFEMQASAGIDSGAKKDFAVANRIAAEGVDNVGTVRSLGVEKVFISRFNKQIAETVAAKRRKAALTGAAFGFSEFCQFLIWYATFKAGGDFVERGHCSFTDMLLASMAILFAAITLGNISVFAPDVAASRLGATQVFRLFDRVSQIDPTDESGKGLDKIEGGVKAKDVHFEYPRRPDVPVLRGLTVEIEKAKTLALVGTSGHGKSTIIALLERFYSIRKGEILIDDCDIKETKLKDLRSHIGLVSQEPELFNRSVFDNIAYGVCHVDGTPITASQVEEAAKVANAHEFVEQLPQGYQTSVGPRGEALSGGQRQRVAIARSLIREPPLLLLDEATSALDSASERKVQQAIDRASSGRTTIVIAHRLSTIRNADVIAVVKRGRIAESGTHDELLRKNGVYAELVQHQLTDV